ncbi:MAG: hypothetical protein ACJZ85_01495 [Pontiellaceae bacterium]
MKRILLALVMICGSVTAQLSIEWQIDLADELDLSVQNYEFFRSSSLILSGNGGVYTKLTFEDFSNSYNNNLPDTNSDSTYSTNNPSIINTNYDSALGVFNPIYTNYINELYVDTEGKMSKIEESYSVVNVMAGISIYSFGDGHIIFRNGSIIDKNEGRLRFIDESGEFNEELISGEFSSGNHDKFNHFYTLTKQIYTNSTPNDNGVFLSYTNNLILTKYSVSSNPTIENIVSGHVSSGFNQDNYVLNWESGLGIQYQIQSSTNLIDWTPVGQVLTGTGYPMTWANHVTNSQAFYRVVED